MFIPSSFLSCCLPAGTWTREPRRTCHDPATFRSKQRLYSPAKRRSHHCMRHAAFRSYDGAAESQQRDLLRHQL
ncbi:hypothetical protein C8Q74DRAFT_1276871 [Fomes fomentarius]|nr:hypothetical protein C8Q74DRAFT_1276834 [Fomes fomentarius]KAI0770674.1 hypothetical protein C8Q74DRAFT_1276871 [Fomes fomentarius]